MHQVTSQLSLRQVPALAQGQLPRCRALSSPLGLLEKSSYNWSRPGSSDHQVGHAAQPASPILALRRERVVPSRSGCCETELGHGRLERRTAVRSAGSRKRQHYIGPHARSQLRMPERMR